MFHRVSMEGLQTVPMAANIRSVRGIHIHMDQVDQVSNGLVQHRLGK